MLVCGTQETYGANQGLKWWVYWRLFYLACSELFRYKGGNEWGVGHYLFRYDGKTTTGLGVNAAQDNGH